MRFSYDQRSLVKGSSTAGGPRQYETVRDMSEEWCVPVAEEASYRPRGFWLTWPVEEFAWVTRRSGEEARAVRQSANGTPCGTFLARAGDLARAQWFLWVWATLLAWERLERPSAEVTTRPFLSPPSRRALVMSTVAAELYLGYAALRERDRWWPGLVRPEDWELAHRRGARRLLNTAEALGGH